jgi:hypothetical protein
MTPAPLLRDAHPPRLRHRGFELALRREGAGGPFAFHVSHLGLRLHSSRPGFGTAPAAERAARRFVDDALGAYGAAVRPAAA